MAPRLAVLGFFRPRRLLQEDLDADQPPRLSSSSPFSHAPTTTECTVPPHLFRVLLQRLQLPLPLTEAACNGCHERLDPLGRHRGACTRSGRIEVLAQDLPCFNGAQLAIDITLRALSALRGATTSSRGGGRGSACPGSPREGGHIPGAVDLKAMPTGRGRN